MNMSILKLANRAGLAVIGAALLLTACNPEPDESDLYTFTGETIESFIEKDSTLTDFNYILGRVGYDRLLASYGNYTCYAPMNEGVKAYCDSLYDDIEAIVPHNGMTERSVEGLTDSLCLSIVRFHLLENEQRDLLYMATEGRGIRTMSGYTFYCSSDAVGNIRLNGVATIVSPDNEAINGLLHKLDSVIPRPNRTVASMFDRIGGYQIFSEALQKTGWADSLNVYEKLNPETETGRYEYNQLPRDGWEGKVDFPDFCLLGFTLFAENDDEMSRNGINSFEDLVAYANRVYAKAPEWYDYMAENNLTVSTGSDYTNPFNALNMFVAYHIVAAKMSPNQLVFEKNQSKYWNYANDADMYDYYETKLPHTMLKVWLPQIVNGGDGKTIYVNRYRTFNTLTNEVGTQGTNHELKKKGLAVDRSIQEANSTYIISISNMDVGTEYSSLLVYDRTVPKMVLSERMRVNCTSLFPELITNGIRYTDTYDGSRYGLPSNYFDNIVRYNEEICFCYCSRGRWRAYQADQLQFWGNFDFAFKLPPVPSDLYEIRVYYAPTTYSAFAQYYIGNSSSIASMRALGLPLDMTIQVDDPRIDWTQFEDEEDRGMASDVVLHNHGFMRAPYGFCGIRTDGSGWAVTNNCRQEGPQSAILRVVLGREQLNQGDENWVRIKLLSAVHNKPMALDCIELVPVSVVDNQEFVEDWY